VLVSPLRDGARGPGGAASVHVKLESPLPAALPAGGASALFCSGICFDRERRVKLQLLAAGARHRPVAVRMPRPDVLAAHGHPRSYRSGWWATVTVRAPMEPGAIELAAVLRRRGAPEQVLPLARIEVTEPPPPRHPRVEEDTVAICMATHDPDPELLAVQLESLRGQSDTRWVCVISDDRSEPERFEQILRATDGDPRFLVSRSERRLGFYRNFERALMLAPPGARLIALCDQDDRWYPDKLAALRAGLGDAQMVYSDQRLVDSHGRVLRSTMWAGRRNNWSNLASLLIANTITGASMLFRREVAELALPFPDTPGLQFHDHWLALVALCRGTVRYLNRPLYDYVQHAGAVFGEVTADARRPARPVAPPPRRPRLERWRAAYFCGWLPRAIQAQTLLARCGDRLSRRKRRALEHYIASQRSPLWFAWLALRPLRLLVGATETLGSELELIGGLVWRRLIVLAAAVWRRRLWDASYPNALAFEQRRLRRWRTRL
jgi:hypothetical protein